MKKVMNMGMHELLQKDPEMWDLFCRKEEYQSSVRDKNNRFPYYASSDRHIFEPKASEYLMKNGYQVEYPKGKPFAVCLTHDIDGVYKSIVEKGIQSLKHGVHARVSETYHSIMQMRSKKIPFVNFEDIMNLEDRYNARSSFYFLALEPKDRDFSYHIEDLEHELGTIKDRGWEIGLHAGRRGSSDPDELKNEKKRLEKVINNSVTGCRNHFLNFVVPDSWEILHAAGLSYDSSLGYADCAGFRNGMCHPFKPFNLNSGKIIDIIEIPLVIMDDSLLDRYMRLDPDQAWEITRELIDRAANCHGVITLLWHNYSFVGEQRKFYEKILHYCAGKDAWMTSGEQLSSWWKHNIKI